MNYSGIKRAKLVKLKISGHRTWARWFNDGKLLLQDINGVFTIPAKENDFVII